MKEIIKNIIKLFFIINLFKLTLSQCTPSISTVSEINPFSSNVAPVMITGTYCNKFGTNLQVSFNLNNQVLGCNDVSINYYSYNQMFSLSCMFDYQLVSSLLQNTFNYNNFTSIFLNGLPSSNGTTSVISISNYLYSNSSCPSGCNNNGVCDVGNTCRCNEGHSSFDCSIKVLNKTLDSPNLPENNTLSFSNAFNHNIYFSMSHVLATKITGDITSQIQQLPLSTMSLQRYNNPLAPDYPLSFMGSNSNSWLTNFGYDIYFSGNVDDGTFTFLNYMGSYLPQSSTFATISLNTTINSQFSGLPSNIFNSTNGDGSFALIFEISGSYIGLNDLTWTQSDSNNSVSIVGNNTLIFITISDLYDFNGDRVPNHATLQVIPPSIASQSLQQYSSSSLYLLLSFDQQSILSGNSTSLSGSYTHRLIINAYSTHDNTSLGWLEILLIVLGSLLGLVILVVAILYLINYLCKRYYHHHHHHHHQLNEQTPLSI